MLHLNNKQNKNTNPIISRQDYHLTQPCPSEEKQTNKQKLSTNLTLYKAHTSHWANLRRAETKRKKEFNLLQGKKSTSLEAWEKETSNTITLKNNNEKAKKYYTNEGTNWKHRSLINEEEIGKLPEKEFRIMIIKMIKTLKAEWRKCKNQLTNT